jgi:S-DNA-T family DNA segregation ATPase FtsK/SpoIIIE
MSTDSVLTTENLPPDPPEPPDKDGNGQGNGEGEPSEPLPPTNRDLQRGALQDLIDLATQCANLESRLDVELRGSLGDAESGNQKALAELERNYKSLQDQIARKYEERAGQIAARYQQNIAALKANDETVRRKAKHDFEGGQEELKKKYDQAIWLAESVLEAAEGKVAEDLKRAQDQQTQQTEVLDAKEAEAKALLDRYNQDPPASPAAARQEGGEGAIVPFEDQRQVIEKQLTELAGLGVPNLFVGIRPYIMVILLVGLSIAVPQLIPPTLDPQWKALGISVGSTLAVLTAGMLALRAMARKQVLAAYMPLRKALDEARRDTDALMDRANMQREVDLAKAAKQQKTETQAAREKAAPILDKLTKKRDAGIAAAQADLQKKTGENESLRKSSSSELEEWRTRKLSELKQKYETELANIGSRTTQKQEKLKAQFAADRAELEKRWHEGLVKIQEPISEEGASGAPWGDASWETWKAPTKFPATIRFGELQVDLQTIVSQIAKDQPFTLPLPEKFGVPALMAYPRQASMMIHTDRQGRADAIKAMQLVMTRLLTCLPPGRVHFTLCDPVGLGQNFSGFMHLGDFDEKLVGPRIWTDAEQIDQRLTNLTEHMETVIQKYLRNEFETIDDYNAQAGELAEPYRFLVIADYPVNISDEAFRRLSSIATTGARCGVYTLIMRDTRITTSAGTHLDDLQAHSINLVREGDKFVWEDDVFKQFPLSIDAAPTDDELTKLLHQVGRKAKDASRVEVPFTSIAPKLPQFWTLKSSGDVQVAIGRMGATRLQMFKLGKGVAQHALIAGKTGSGKSTLLHALISNLAMWYSPEEIELYLIDFKKGVEFKTYAAHLLPHARAIAVESDREFGLSVLQRIDGELTRRGNLYRRFGSQDLNSYRNDSKEKMPRTLLIIDEFQEFFSEDDKLAADASLLLDRLVRQGRAFGIHVLLGSQTIGGSSGLSRSTIGQIAVRIALQTSEADSQLILGDGNSAARLLSRPGEAIYNDAGGLVEGNSPFQVAWLADEQRDIYLEEVNQKVRETGMKVSLPIVFEGNAPADIRKNTVLMEYLKAPKYEPLTGVPVAWLGDPVAIKAATAVNFRRQSGSSILIVGQNEEAALAMMSQGMVGLATQLAPKDASFYVLDGSPTDSPSYGVLGKVAAALPHQSKIVEYRAVPEAIHELALELAKRQEADASNPPAIFVMIFGMQRYRSLRKSDESFSFSASDEEKPADPGKEFADLMRDGPASGIHIISWIDTATALDRALDRTAMREFDNRILFQMSATDSSNLIDSPAANKLGVNRAMAYSEEQGTTEKFRPYAPVDAGWLAEVKEKLGVKAAAS